MDITDLLSADSVVSHLKATGKKQALQELAVIAARTVGREDREIFDILLERERLGTTGVGHGSARPLGKLKELDRLHGVFARLERPIDFDAIDDEPVALVFVLLAPETAGADHLKALARVSRLLRDTSVCEKIRGCDSRDAIYAVLTEQMAASHAA